MQREPPKPSCATDEEAKEWAAKWWQEFSATDWRGGKAEGRLYQIRQKLFELMKPAGDDGLAPVKLVRGSWLLKRASMLRHASTDEERAKLRMPRRQELERDEPDALLSPEEAAAMPRGYNGRKDCCFPSHPFERRPLKLISISHGWLTPDHPDPLGEQLVKFADVVARERSCFREGDNCACFGAARAARASALPGLHAGACRYAASSAATG